MAEYDLGFVDSTEDQINSQLVLTGPVEPMHDLAFVAYQGGPAEEVDVVRDIPLLIRQIP